MDEPSRHRAPTPATYAPGRGGAMNEQHTSQFQVPAQFASARIALSAPAIAASAFRHSAATFSGTLDQLPAVRAYVRAELAAHPALDAAELAASELSANAVIHTASGHPGGKFEVHVAVLGNGRAAIFVADQGAPTIPRAQGAGADAESGRGLDLVTSFAEIFTVTGDDNARGILVVIR